MKKQKSKRKSAEGAECFATRTVERNQKRFAESLTGMYVQLKARNGCSMNSMLKLHKNEGDNKYIQIPYRKTEDI